ncbi:MAG: hypothetical protein WAU27_14985 [Pseudomonadales bacterium]
MNHKLASHIRAQTRNNFLINLVLNGLIAWFLLKDKPALSAGGEHGYGPDLVITGFLLAALVAVFTMKIHRGQLAKGQHEAVPEQALGAIARVASRSDWLNSLLFGVAGAMLAGATVGVLVLLPVPPFEPLAYALFKGVWAGILAALVVPPAIRIGLRATS